MPSAAPSTTSPRRPATSSRSRTEVSRATGASSGSWAWSAARSSATPSRAVSRPVRRVGRLLRQQPRAGHGHRRLPLPQPPGQPALARRRTAWTSTWASTTPTTRSTTPPPSACPPTARTRWSRRRRTPRAAGPFPGCRTSAARSRTWRPAGRPHPRSDFPNGVPGRTRSPTTPCPRSPRPPGEDRDLTRANLNVDLGPGLRHLQLPHGLLATPSRVPIGLQPELGQHASRWSTATASNPTASPQCLPAGRLVPGSHGLPGRRERRDHRGVEPGNPLHEPAGPAPALLRRRLLLQRGQQDLSRARPVATTQLPESPVRHRPRARGLPAPPGHRLLHLRPARSPRTAPSTR